MAITARRTPYEMLRALVYAFNKMRTGSPVIGSSFHADVTSQTTGDLENPTVTPLTLTSTNASDLPTTLALCAEMAIKYPKHIADAIAHKNADTTNTLSAAAATDQSTANTFLNDVKAKFNAHLTQSNVHYTNDGTNTIATANATDAATSQALANAIKTAFNAHIQGAPAGSSIQIVD